MPTGDSDKTVRFCRTDGTGQWFELGKVTDLKAVEPLDMQIEGLQGIDLTGLSVGWGGEVKAELKVADANKLFFHLIGIPTVNIITCKNCQFYDPKEKMCNDLYGYGRKWEPNDFCSKGKLKCQNE